MQEIKQIRKKMNIPQREIAVYLNITLKTYTLWEKKGCTTYYKKKILIFLKDYEFKDRFLGLGVVRLAELLNVNVGNLSVYMRSGKEIKGLDKALEKRRNELIDLKYQCMVMLTKC